MIRDPEDVMNDGRDAMKEIKERMDWDVHALPRLMETLNDQIYRLEMSIADHRPKKETLEVLRAMSTTLGLMTEVCE
jgi:phytoene/squalene synthetase